MSLPQIEDTFQGYMLSWPEEQLRIDVGYINNHNISHITAELLITTTKKGYKPHLHQAQFNLSSDVARQRLARIMEKRYEASWESILEQLCVRVLQRIREGEPVQEISSTEPATPPKFLLKPLLLKDLPTAIYGEKAVGKSTLVLIVIACLILPWSDNPLNLSCEDQPIPILLLDWEGNADITRWNISCLAKGMELGAIDFPYRRCRMPLADDIDAIARAIDRSKAKIVIIDSLARAAGGELGKPEIADRFFCALDKLKCSSLIIAQTTKDEHKKKSIFGSVFFTYYCRLIWRVESSGDENTLNVGLFQEQSNYTGRFPPIGFKLKWEEDTLTVLPNDPKTVPEFQQYMSAQNRVRELLKRGAMTVQDISQTLELSLASTRQALHRLKEKRIAIKLPSGEWGLPSKEEKYD